MTDEPHDIDDNDDDDDGEEFDWAEAERRARFFDEVGQAMKRINAKKKKAVQVRLARLPVGTRLEIQTYTEGHEPIECTLHDPATGAITVTDNHYFMEPTACVLWGSNDDLDGNGAQLPGVIKYNAKVVFQVAGKRIEEHGPELRIMRLLLYVPNSEKALNPWE